MKLPFSFVYGGRHSSEFLGDWDPQVGIGEVSLTDPVTGLRVLMVYREYDYPCAKDWTLYFTNLGEADTPIIEQVMAVDVRVNTLLQQTRNQPVILHRLNGSSCLDDDLMPVTNLVKVGERIDFATIGGRPADGYCPFFNVQIGNRGIITAIGWTGQWRACVEHVGWHYPDTGPQYLQITAGMEHMHLSLRPLETIRSPRILQLHWEDGLDDGYNQFRRLMLKHIAPRRRGELVVPPIAYLGSSCNAEDGISEEYTLRHLESIKDVGFECHWVDAFYLRGSFPGGAGNYGFPFDPSMPEDRFPRGMKPISDAAHAAGMESLLWCEVERVVEGTALYRDHREWITSVGASQHNLYNLGIPEAREYITRYLCMFIRLYDIDWLRMDCNIFPLAFWHKLDLEDPNRAGMAEIRHVEGLYQMWDELRATFPDLALDISVSGGRRIDLESCSRLVPLWRSDLQGSIIMTGRLEYDRAAILSQVQSAGLNRYLPYSTVGARGTSPYHFRSGFNGGISFSEECDAPDYPLEELRQAIAEGKRIRKYFAGNFYPPAEVNLDPATWCVMQYHCPKGHEGLVLAFRRHECEAPFYKCDLREIDIEHAYEVIFSKGYQPSPTVVMTGIQLRDIVLEIRDQPGSVLVEYRKIV